MHKFTAPPLSFVGNKKYFSKIYLEFLDFALLSGVINKQTIFLDCFGGSGWLSHITKQRFPKNRVIWNDYDNYQERLERIPQTNAIRQELLRIKEKNLSKEKTKQEILKVLNANLNYDLRTISGYLTFCGQTLKEDLSNFVPSALEKITKTTIKEPIGYLEGVERVQSDAVNLIETSAGGGGYFLILDPPYLQTHSKSYEGYFNLSDYARLLNAIKKPYCLFGSAKSDILELLSLVEEKEQIKGFCVYGESFTKMNQGIKDRDYLIYNF
ncbi:hypothetical protein [Helicobacter ganmani]|uniref:hypothetical protein n=1 Tax=Helicobacter ganmani TaxID=60246 RepID=UPI003A843ACE